MTRNVASACASRATYHGGAALSDRDRNDS